MVHVVPTLPAYADRWTSGFPVIELPDSAPEVHEPRGTTDKFWFDDKHLLFKQSRPGTGEHWAEKLATELALEMGLIAPDVQLARWRGHFGVISRSFLSEGQKFVQQTEFLKLLISQIAGENHRNCAHHTLENILWSLTHVDLPMNWFPPPGICDAKGVFTGYLVLDAWIANEDRHRENWGVIATSSTDNLPRYTLAPTFDHASSLGRELNDSKRQEILASNLVSSYAANCASGIFSPNNFREPLTAHEVLQHLAEIEAVSLRMWLEVLLSISSQRLIQLLDNVPSEAMQAEAKDFALAILTANSQRMKHLCNKL